MFNQTFGQNLLRKYVIYFGTVFNNIWLNRYDLNDNLIQRSKVPINYGPRDKFLARKEGNEDLRRPIAIQLPRMAFEMVDLQYDPTRRLNAVNKFKVVDPNDSSKYLTQYSPVPYNIVFRLSIMVKNVLDGTYIVEQILPYFGPTWQATLTVNNDMNLKHDVPITLNDITQEDTYEGFFEQRRAIIWSLTFTMKAWFFGPVISQDSGIIKQIDLNFRPVATNLNIFEDANQLNSPTKLKVQISPGVDLNDLPISMTNGYKYNYQLENASGPFIVTEQIIDSTNARNFAYVKETSANNIVSINTSNTLEVGTEIIGLISGSTATISDVEKLPEVVPWEDVLLDSNYGFIYDIFEDL